MQDQAVKRTLDKSGHQGELRDAAVISSLRASRQAALMAVLGARAAMGDGWRRRVLLHHSYRGSNSNPATHSPLACTGHGPSPCGEGRKQYMPEDRNASYVWALAASAASVIIPSTGPHKQE